MDQTDDVIKSKPEHLVIHIGTKDLTNGINLLSNAKKIVKKITKSHQRHVLTFQEQLTGKTGKTLTKKITETNQRLKNYCRQKDINYIGNANIIEDCLGAKKLYLNRKGNSCFVKNLLKYLNNV